MAKKQDSLAELFDAQIKTIIAKDCLRVIVEQLQAKKEEVLSRVKEMKKIHGVCFMYGAILFVWLVKQLY